jgi:hypothetical protein
LKEEGVADSEMCSSEHNAMMQRRVELNRNLADLNGRLEDAEAYRKQLLQTSEGWSSLKQKYEVSLDPVLENIQTFSLFQYRRTFKTWKGTLRSSRMRKLLSIKSLLTRTI